MYNYPELSDYAGVRDRRLFLNEDSNYTPREILACLFIHLWFISYHLMSYHRIIFA